MSSLSAISSSQYEKLICAYPPLNDEKIFLEYAAPKDFHEYRRLTQTSFRSPPPSPPAFSKSDISGKDITVALLVLGGGYLLGGPVGLGLGAALLSKGCYPVEKVGVGRETDNEPYGWDGEAEGEGEDKTVRGAEAEAEAESEVEPKVGAEGESEAEAEGESEMEVGSEAEAEAESESEAESEGEHDFWTPISNEDAPRARHEHAAVWTGSEMIVWGGTWGASGGRYNLMENRWTPINAEGSPPADRAVWTGSRMVVWGTGWDSQFDDEPSVCPVGSGPGGSYSPLENRWFPTSQDGAPAWRIENTVVWTGSEMIAWGGEEECGADLFNSGGKLHPATNSWTPTDTTGAPSERMWHTAVWTGSEMIVWGGYNSSGNRLATGSRYHPVSDTWTPTNLVGAPSARSVHTAVWTGSEMIVWGGNANTGGRFDPVINTWTPTSIDNAPSARWGHSAVWTSSEMIVWGGCILGRGNCTRTSLGGRYNPVEDRWASTNNDSTPLARTQHTAVWTGSEMIVWGGLGYVGGNLDTGGRYTP